MKARRKARVKKQKIKSEPNSFSTSASTVPPTPASSSDEDDDLDVDLFTLAKRPAKNHQETSGTSAPKVVATISLSDSEDEEEQNNAPTKIRKIDPEIAGSCSSSNGKYPLRQRSTAVNYSDQMLEDEDDAENVAPTPSSLPSAPSSSAAVSKKGLKKDKKSEPLEILFLKPQQLRKYTKAPWSMEEFSKWSINLVHLQKMKIEKDLFTKLLTKCSSVCHEITIITSKSPDTTSMDLNLLGLFFQNAKELKHVEIRYGWPSKNILEPIFKEVVKLPLQTLDSLKLMSRLGDGFLMQKDISAIHSCGLQFRKVVLGDAVHYGGREELERLLENQKDSLENLTIHGGFKGEKDTPQFTLNFPRGMPHLTVLSICPVYSYVSNKIVNPASQKSRIIVLDNEPDSSTNFIASEPLRFTLKFDGEFPVLEKLILGNLVELYEFGFYMLRKLQTFKCGSYWNLALRFPPPGSRQSLKHSTITELQIPDALKDPLFIVKLGEYFPGVKKIWMALPSVPVLRAFFKAFENSKLEELYLKTQFDFDSTMESCLLPEFKQKLTKESKTVLETLKAYKYFEDYVRYHNIELPLEDPNEDLVSGYSAGIRSLKTLKRLELEHIQRKLMLPNPEDERKWYDHNFKYLSTTFGFQDYPLSKSCVEEITSIRGIGMRFTNMNITAGGRAAFKAAGRPLKRRKNLPKDTRLNFNNEDVQEDVISDEEDFVPPQSLLQPPPSAMPSFFGGGDEDDLSFHSPHSSPPPPEPVPKKSKGKRKRGVNILVKSGMMIVPEFKDKKEAE